MEIANLDFGKFYGKVCKQFELDQFNLTLTEYVPGYKIVKHQHQTPYLSLLLNGNYKESSKGKEQIVLQGNIVFRPSGYEHTNEFENSLGRCFNIELKSGTFPYFETFFKKSKAIFINQSSIAIYLLLQSFFNGTENSLNIYALNYSVNLLRMKKVKILEELYE